MWLTAAEYERMVRRGDRVMKPIRIAAWFAVSLILVFTACELLLYATNLRTRHKTEALLATVRPWRLRETTLAATQPFLVSYEAQKTPSPKGEQSYSIIVANQIVNAIGSKYPGLWRFGSRPWGLL
jgi:hypothetical protein